MDLIQNPTDGSSKKIARIRDLIDAKNGELLTHRYFRLCHTKGLSRAQVVDVLKQVHCFSILFERLMTRVIAEYSTSKDPRVIAIARQHLREEMGHAQLFADCLHANGVSPEEIARLSPKMFTKALFGYLNVTIQYENEYVCNVAIMQVMESIGFHFFVATLNIMQAHSMSADIFQQHALEDEVHANAGIELIPAFDSATMRDCERIINDLYRLMSFVLDEWMGGYEQATTTRERKRRTTRPPRSN